MDNALNNLSPLDGRYQTQVSPLNKYFSESALIKYRLLVEVEYLIALSQNSKIKAVRKLTSQEENKLRTVYNKFDLTTAKRVKEIEKITNHDVKACEYFLNDHLAKTSLKDVLGFVHFALTSEDTNNLAYSLMWKEAVENEYLPQLKAVIKQLTILANKNRKVAMLALTHGQPATPTTLGKEMAVYVCRLQSQLKQLEQKQYLGKLGGATGNWAAQQVSYPEVDWLNFSQRLVKFLGLKFNPLTTQIESHDSLVEAYDNLRHINNILIGFCQDMWLYISRGLFGQEKKKAEVGSSTMPHKINPIYFENAEGNLGLADSILVFFSEKLTKSRLQRDLTDSTVLRNQGLALGYSYLALKSLLNGLSRLKVNTQALKQELNQHWEVLTEAIQTVLKKNKVEQSYEQVKALVHGQTLNRQQYQALVKALNLPKAEQRKLLLLTPEKYTGLSDKLVELI